MFMSNFAIVFKFMKATCRSNSTESTNQALAKSATRGTAVSITFIALTTPTAVHGTAACHSTTKQSNVSCIYEFNTVFNHSINGVLYCIVGSRFRKEFLKIIGRKKRPDTISTSCSVTNASVTTISGTRV